MGTKVMNVSIRNFEEGDLSDLVAVERALVADGRGQVCGPEDVADEGALRERLAPGPRSLRLVALHEGRLVGSAGWHRYRPQLLQHVASLDVGVHPAAQGLGLGRKLMQALVGRATREGIERLELFVRADNPRAIGLYRSLGFELEGTRRGLVKQPDGTLVDDHIMARWLVEGGPKTSS